jgi:hypothetical protein
VTSVIVGFIVLLLDLNGKIGFLHFVWAVLFPLVDFLLVEFLALRSSCPRPRSGFRFGACLHQPPRDFLSLVFDLSSGAGSSFGPNGEPLNRCRFGFHPKESPVPFGVGSPRAQASVSCLSPRALAAPTRSLRLGSDRCSASWPPGPAALERALRSPCLCSSAIVFPTLLKCLFALSRMDFLLRAA